MSPIHVKQWYPWLRGAGVIGILTLLTTGPIYTFSHIFIGPTTGWDDPKVKYPYIAIGVASAIIWLITALRQELVALSRGLIVGGVLTGLFLLSSWWSVSPEVTLWRSLVYVGLFLLAWVLCSLSEQELIVVISAMLLMGFGLSAGVRLFWPGFFSNADGLWQGVYTNPNSFGPVAALTILCALYWLFVSQQMLYRIAAVLVMLGAALVLVRTKSDTALIGLAISMAITALVAAGKYLWDKKQRLVVIVSGTAIALIGVIATTAYWSSLWHQGGLAQRREVWGEVLVRINIRPGFGNGFFMYWEDSAAQSPRFLARAGSAHNSVLDSALSVGWIGAALFVAVCAIALYVGIHTAITRPRPLSWLWCALSIFLVVEHSFESFVLWFSYLWVLLIVAAHGPAIERLTASRFAQAHDNNLAHKEPVEEPTQHLETDMQA